MGFVAENIEIAKLTNEFNSMSMKRHFLCVICEYIINSIIVNVYQFFQIKIAHIGEAATLLSRAMLVREYTQ